MAEFKCACCATPIGDLLPDDWTGCRRCGCGTAERKPLPRPALIDPATVSAQLVAMLEPDLRAFEGNDHE